MTADNRDRLDADVLTVARLAGLALAIEQFPGDVAIAARSAERACSTLPPIADPTAQPWPPMQLRRTR